MEAALPFQDDEAVNFLAIVKGENLRRNFFFQALTNPVIHWFFTQGQEALEKELYVPGVAALLNGIEASIRVTAHQIDAGYDGNLELGPRNMLSNWLLRRARDLGMPTELLAWPEEVDFQAKVQTNDNVFVVQLRHDGCHGNLARFIEHWEFEDLHFFTPEHLRPVAAQLLEVSYDWALALGQFRAENDRRPNDLPMPERPANPLAEWLPR